jgi:hypothetical protein
MFDLGSAYFGDGDADIARLLLMYGMGGPEPGGRPHAFLQAYFRGATAQSARPGFVERVTMYFLMDSVVFWSFFRKLGNYDAFPDFRTWFEPQLGNFRKNLTAIVQSL